MAFSSHHRRPSGIYIFSSFPRSVEAPNNTLNHYGDFSYDPHQSTVYTLSSTLQNIADEEQKQEEIKRRRSIARKRALVQLRPKPVPTRIDSNVQTHPYFEKWDNIAVAEGTGCQTDTLPFVPPIVIPPKTGRDAATQLEERDLIVFDRDVRPVVEILVGKTIEQSLLEVMEEEELAFVRAQQKALQEILNEERAQVHRLQEQERRHREAKESKMAQQWKVLMKEKETAEKIAAWAYTQRYLADLKPTVITTLKNDGFLYDPVERDLETNFMPGLLSEIYVVMEGRQAAREVLDTVMYQVSHIRLKVLRAAQRAGRYW